MGYTIPLKVVVGSTLWLVTTDREKHPLCQMGRTATVVDIIYRANGKPQQYVVLLHCTTAKERGDFASRKTQYIAALGMYVGVLPQPIALPQSYFGVVREQTTIR